MKKIFYIFILTGLGCSKPEQDKPIEPTYTVTFSIENNTPSYWLSIQDITNKNDFGDSIRQTNFSKTIVYNYKATYRCDIINPKNKVSSKKIKITYDTITNICEDSIYPSLNCWLVLN